MRIYERTAKEKLIMIITMGQTQSKDEVIIAQSGANSANANFETKLEMISCTLLGVLAVVGLIITFCMYKKCKKGSESWLRKQIIRLAPMGAPTVMAQPTAEPRPPKVIIS